MVPTFALKKWRKPSPSTPPWRLSALWAFTTSCTVVLNGERIIDGQTIPGITGGALDSDEGAPGPILLQGDHGPIDFRRVTLTPAE